jgi:fucose 4-O-acetylase-like acetyltransferase
VQKNVNENKRIEWIDTAKGIGLLLVMIGHFRMPLFFSYLGLYFRNRNIILKIFLLNG